MRDEAESEDALGRAREDIAAALALDPALNQAHALGFFTDVLAAFDLYEAEPDQAVADFEAAMAGLAAIVRQEPDAAAGHYPSSLQTLAGLNAEERAWLFRQVDAADEQLAVDPAAYAAYGVRGVMKLYLGSQPSPNMRTLQEAGQDLLFAIALAHHHMADLADPAGGPLQVARIWDLQEAAYTSGDLYSQVFFNQDPRSFPEFAQMLTSYWELQDIFIQFVDDPIIFGIAFSPDGAQIATLGESGPSYLRLWDVASGEKLREVELGLDGRVIATTAGNVEPWPTDYDAVTTIEALPAYSRNGVLVQWGGHDLGGSEMRGYDVQVRQGNGVWTDWHTEVAETSAYFEGTAGERYSFRVRGRDSAQNLEAWPTTADTATTLYAWAISGKATDNRGAPVADLTTTTSPAAFLSTPSDITGAYVAYGSDPAPNYSVTWNKAAYGALPATGFPSDADAELDIVLPPVGNVVQNWGFEDGSAAWQFGGNLNGEVTSSDKHTGAAAAFLNSIVSAQNASLLQHIASTPAAGEATLSQVVQVPQAALAPTLSFLHRFSTEFPSNSRLEVIVDDGISPLTVFSINTNADAWQHAWADLTSWAGRSVTLTFKLIEVAGGARAWAYIDEVSVGSAHPDAWVNLASRGAAPPGARTDCTLIYGNRGAAASNGHVTLQLPPELTFISADPPPAATTPDLRWDVGDLAGGAAPAAVQVTLQVAASAVQGTRLTATAAIASDTPEIEQANNTAQAATFVGHRIYLPMVGK